MRVELCSDYLHHLDGDGELSVDAPSPTLSEWLATLDLPRGLLSLMQASWPQEGGYIGNFFIQSTKQIKDDDDRGRLMQHRLLKIGSGPNGDLLALDLASDELRPVIISHEVFWEDPVVDPRTCMAPITRSLASLLFRLDERRYVPPDYPAAQEFNAFLAEEGETGA